MAQDAFIHETDDANIDLPKGENLSVYRKSGIVRNPPDAAAPFQVLHPDGYLEPLATAAGGAGVQTVTGFNVNNADPANPIILPTEADGVTITGSGTVADPFVAAGSPLNILEFQTVGLVPAVYTFEFDDGDIFNYKITGTNGVAGVYIFDRGFSPLSNGVTTIFDNSTGTSGEGQSIVLSVVGNTLTVTITGLAAETWNWVFEYIFSEF